MNRRPVVILLAAWTMGLTGSACSPETRYRMLTFLFDGVPDPNAAPAVIEVATDRPVSDGAQPEARPSAQQIHVHPPYREGRCASCHNTQTGQLFRSPEEGLCGTCHSAVTDAYTYSHGPVAVDACLFCHHHHSSSFPHVLLDEPEALCFACHDRTATESGFHHVQAADQACLDCHNPHGGDNRFFLKRSGS